MYLNARKRGDKMRVVITNAKDKLSSFLFTYMELMLDGRKAEIIINGNKTTGLIREFWLNETDGTWLEITIDDEIKKIPLTDETKARLGNEVFYFETKTHTTVIEFLN